MARRVSRPSGPKRSPLAWAGIGCGSVVALGLIGALVVYMLATAAPAPPPEARDSVATTSTSTGQPSASTSPAPSSPDATSGSATVAAPPLETQMQYVEQAMRSSRPVQVRMIVTESELNALLAREAGSGDVQNPRVYFGDGTVVTTGEVTWQGRQLSVTVRAHPVVSGGNVELAIDEVSVGRMPAPTAIREQVGQKLNESMSRLTGRGRLHVESAQVTAGQMTLTGRAGGGS